MYSSQASKLIAVVMDMLTRYAHFEGHTDLSFDDTGKYLITCGSDGDIRIWDGFKDDDPKTHHIGEIVTAVAFKKNTIYVSSDTNAVVVYSFPNVTCEGVILQFMTSVYHIVCSSSGKYVAAGGGDFVLKIYDNSSQKFYTYRDHNGPILSIAFDPTENYVASASCDGTVKIWYVTSQNCAHTIKLFKKSNDFCTSDTLCRLEWHPEKGKYLAVPVDKEVKLFERDSWNLMYVLKDPSIDMTVSIVSFSVCGSYIASSCNSGLVVVWNIESKESIFKHPHPKSMKICGLAWNTSGKKEIAFCDVEGNLGLYDNIFEKKNNAEEFFDLDALADDDFGSNDDSLGMYDGPAKKLHIRAPDRNDGNATDAEEDNIFDIGAIKAKYETKIFGEDVSNDGVASVHSIELPIASEPKSVVPVPLNTQQKSFQPSSTPLHLDHRFMLWNNVGIVRCYNTDHENSIDVEFHEAQICHPIHLDNNKGFTMASLSSEALLLASPLIDESHSKLQCLHFGTWDSNKEWTITMTDSEEIEAITLGIDWIGVATDHRLIRLFSISGVQCEVFCCPGPVVCLAASDTLLAIAYHKGAGLSGEQNLGLMLVNVNLGTFSSCREYPLPISPKSYLSWLGFTDEGQVTTFDTSGIIRLLSMSHSVKWIPIANTKHHTKGKSDSYFVVGLSEIHQEIRCIPCKGSRYPAMLPRPTVTVIPFHLPFCDLGTEKGKYEEEYARCAISHSRMLTLLNRGFDLESRISEVEQKKETMLFKLFALAAKSDHQFRAVDVVELMPSPSAVQMAIRYATQLRQITLADRLGEIMHRKQLEGDSLPKVNEYADIDDKKENCLLDYVPTNSRLLSSLSKEVECEKLRPKPLSLSHHRNSLERNSDSLENLGDRIDYDEIDEDKLTSDEKKDTGISLLPASSPMINPFKVQHDKRIGVSSNIKQNAKIDNLLKGSTNRLSTNRIHTSGQESKSTSPEQDKKSTKKTSNNGPALAPKKFGFPLFLEQNRANLMAKNPDSDENGILKFAMKEFKALAPEEKEKYSKFPKDGGPKDTEQNLNKRKLESEPAAKKDNSTKKSKLDNNESESGKKNTLLSMFAFVKKNAA